VSAVHVEGGGVAGSGRAVVAEEDEQRRVIEDVAGGGRVAEPVADVLDPVGGGRDGLAVRAGGQVQVAERVRRIRCPPARGEGRERAERRARPGRGRGAPGWCYWVVPVTTRNWSVLRSITT
jgi:hypothetical protein